MEERFILNTTIAQQVAQGLLEIEAIKLSPNKPFTWASGWLSPIYCDNRLSLSFPRLRKTITQQLVKAIKEKYPEAEAIAGVATAGIPQGALVAEALELPFLYVRSSAKSHGMTNLIEGKIVSNQKVVVIEDLISTGGSSLKAVEDLRASGFNVLGMAAIFTYAFDVATKNFNKASCDLVCLSDYHELIKVANLPEKEQEALKAWRVSPSEWSK
jgi:orotate phosphoribosyltransferase